MSNRKYNPGQVWSNGQVSIQVLNVLPQGHTSTLHLLRSDCDRMVCMTAHRFTKLIKHMGLTHTTTRLPGGEYD